MGGSSPNSDYKLFFWKYSIFCDFCVVLIFTNVSKKIDRGLGSDYSEFFSDYWICFNLTRPLSKYSKYSDILV